MKKEILIGFVICVGYGAVMGAFLYAVSKQPTQTERVSSCVENFGFTVEKCFCIDHYVLDKKCFE